MSRYAFDTDTLSLYQSGHTKVVQAVASHNLADLAITVISVDEQLSGWYRLLRRVTRPDHVARAYRRLAESIPFLAQFPILSFTERAIARHEQLDAMRLNVGKMDLKIAAIAVENGCTVVTRNERDFRRVPGLVVENWAS
jgi:tRNA(fMet)-specific endonuclease VapC